MNRLAAFALAATALVAMPAEAVLVEGGTIEIDEVTQKSTTDLWFFDLATAIDVSFNFLALPGPITTETIAVGLYQTDGAGTITGLLELIPGAAAQSSVTLDRLAADGDQLAAGSYAFLIGTFALAATEFPPFQTDPNVPTGLAGGLMPYEFALAGPAENEISFTCILSGHLDGSVTQVQRVAGAQCNIPAAVNEPALAGALGGLAVLTTVIAARRRAG